MALQEKKKSRTVAVIFAGYDKFNLKTKLRLRKEIIESYDGDEIFLGTNKFLYDVCGKAVIQYVLDSVYRAKKDGKRLYDEIYVYNDRENFLKVIDAKKYKNLVVRQMAESVAGHLKDFYTNFVEYGDRVDMFFGDTPRITPDDVVWSHDEYGKIIGKKKDQRGVPIRIAYGVVRYSDMKDNWLPHRIKYFKRGEKKGRIKSYVQFEKYQGRVGNSLAFVKHPSLDPMIEHEVVNLFYNIRKALTPRAISRIMYYLWKTKHLGMIRQIKRRSIKESEMIAALIDVVSHFYKIDVSDFAGAFMLVTRNAAHWENDIDGPNDLRAFRERFLEGKSCS